jgi:hypothetical protein
VLLVLDAVSLMELSECEEDHRVGGVRQAPFARSILLAVLIYAHGHGILSSRAIKRLCRRGAGYRPIVCEPVPDYTVSGGYASGISISPRQCSRRCCGFAPIPG